MTKVVTIGKSVKIFFLYFLLSPDFDLPSFSSQALSQVKDSHYQVVQYFNFSLLSPDRQSKQTIKMGSSVLLYFRPS